MKERPQKISGNTYKVKCPCGDLFVTCNDDPFNGQLFECFATLGKAGGCGAANKTAVGMLISIALRSGADVTDIIKCMNGVTCHKSSEGAQSCITQIALAIKDHEDEKRKTGLMGPNIQPEEDVSAPPSR